MSEREPTSQPGLERWRTSGRVIPGLSLNGLYVLYWREGGWSYASVGALHSGARWYAPCNWSSKLKAGVTATDWLPVQSATLLWPEAHGVAPCAIGPAGAPTAESGGAHDALLGSGSAARTFAFKSR